MPAFNFSGGRLPVGTVVEQRQDGRTFLIVQETDETTSVIESWDQAFDVANRMLGRLGETLGEMNEDMAAFNARISADLRETGAKIAANQLLLNELVNRA